jgi:trans-2,3-dihydro-3-hydroxyanthranilate isomerase
MPRVRFQTVDVFTTTRFGGNPLAVVPDARELSTEQMQAIAREFNYSESTFVLPPDDPAHTARIRIFVPTQEIPFAGHPNVGTAFVLAQQPEIFGKPTTNTMTFEEIAGLVAITISGSGHDLRATITAPERLSICDLNPDVDLAACVGLTPADISIDRHKPVIASVGLPFAIAQVTDLAALARAVPGLDAFTRNNPHWGVPGLGLSIMLYTPDTGDPKIVRARMFAPLDNVTEDPATGSASGALGAFLAHLEPQSDGQFTLIVNQGFEMGRPSIIDVTSTKRAGQVESVRITGNCVPVMTGTIDL